MGHESFERTEELQIGSDRSFGFLFAVVFGLLALWFFWGAGSSWPWLLSIAAVFAIISVVRPVLLAPLNRLWMKFGALLHRIVSPIILGIIFFGTVLPTGLLMRLFGKDILRLAWDKSASSYWIERTPPGPAPDSLKDQF